MKEAPKKVTVRCPAKLNLTLEVIGRRDDGYHDLASVFQAVSLFDEIVVERASELTLECDRPELQSDDNLVLRAARLLRDAAGVTSGARIGLTKRIPAAAGLGGGSADAAGALVGLARLWDTNLKPGEMAALASQLGSDVPFFLGSPAAVVRGRGEIIEPAHALKGYDAVIVRPGLPVPAGKTGQLYRSLQPGDYADGSATAALAAALSAGQPINPAILVNSFDRAADQVFPGLAVARAGVLASGAVWVRLAGSGPSLFTLTPSGNGTTGFLAGEVRHSGYQCWVARCLSGPSALEVTDGPPLLEKMLIRPGDRVILDGLDDPDFRERLDQGRVEVVTEAGDEPVRAVILGVDNPERLTALRDLVPAIWPDGAIWVANPRGVPELSVSVVIAAAKAAGLVDHKVVRFSETRTALRLVVPIERRKDPLR